MTIQIYGKTKCFDTQKAERYFKERHIPYQRVDILKYGLSRGEYQSVKAAAGGLRALIDEKSKAYEALFIPYLSTESAIEEKLLGNPALYKTPIVRNGKKATIGYHPEIWKTWE